MRKFMELVIEDTKKPERKGKIHISETNEVVKKGKRKRFRIEDGNREIEKVGLGYYDFFNEEDYENRIDEVMHQKLKEIDKKHLEDARIEDVVH